MDVAGPPPALSPTIVMVAALEVIQFECVRVNQTIISDTEILASQPSMVYACELVVRGRGRTSVTYCGKGATFAIAIAETLKSLCRQPFRDAKEKIPFTIASLRLST